MMELVEFLMLSMEVKKNLMTLSLSASDKSMMELFMVIKVKDSRRSSSLYFSSFKLE